MTIGLGEKCFLLVVNDDHVSILHGYRDTGLQKFCGHKYDLMGTCDVTGHVTTGLGICGFLLVVHCNHASILHCYGNLKSQRYWGHDLDLLGSRDVIDHRTRHGHFLIGGQWWPCAYLAYLARIPIRSFKDFGVTSLTLWGHVASSVTWPLDSAYVVSYWWFIVTIILHR